MVGKIMIESFGQTNFPTDFLLVLHIHVGN